MCLSFRVKVADAVDVKDRSKQLAMVPEAIALAERNVPDDIDLGRHKMIAQPVMMKPHLWVEYYSR